MLNRTKFLKELTAAGSRIFSTSPHHLSLAQSLWDAICNDPTFAFRTSHNASPFSLPVWTGHLNDAYAIEPLQRSYTIIGCDGSQVYPDRNMPGSGCFLINMGGVVLSYGAHSSATFFSDPSIFLAEDIFEEDERFTFSKDFVDLKREEYEFRAMFAQMEKQSTANLGLFDGSLIFWHLESKPEEIKNYFLEQYCSLLEQFCRKSYPIAGYISAPKSRDLLNLILFECEYNPEGLYKDISKDSFARLNDAHIVSFFLDQFERTTLFESTSPIVASYPPHLRPYFFYLNLGEEIARIEVPACFAPNTTIINEMCMLIADQARKGNGYPVCLAEAHEQAVIKGADREFFYHALSKMSIEQKRSVAFSQKSLKKRRMSI